MNKILTYITLTLSAAATLFAEDLNNSVSVGFYSFGDHTIHKTNMDKFRYNNAENTPEVVGSGNGINLGLLVEKRLDKNLSLGFRIGMNSYSATFQRVKSTSIMLDQERINANYIDKVDVDISEIGVMPIIKYHWNNFGIFSGFNLSILNDALYDSYHELSAKFKEGEFLDEQGNPTGTNFRDPEQDDLPQASDISANFVIGLNYDISVLENLVFSPEFSVGRSMISPINNYDWNYYHYNFGFSLRYLPIQKEAIPTPLVSISLFPIDEKGDNRNSIEYEKISETNVVPLLNSVYFEPTSTEIPDRYKKISESETSDYYINSYCSNVMNTYQDILNIIGRRMKGNTGTNVILRSIIFDENNGDVAFYIERAQNIKKYLNNVWDIDSNRFVIEVLKINSNKFQFAKYKNSPDSYNNIIEEHNRVDIIPENMEVIAPVIVFDTTHNIKTDNLSLMTHISNGTKVQRWDYEFKVNNINYHNIDGTGEIPSQMNIPVSSKMSSSLPAKIDYNLQLRTKHNHFAFKGEIQLQGKENFKNRIKYYLIWKNQDDIKSDNFGLEMAELINLSVTEDTKITINSHTDNTGFNRTNRIRSEARADAFSDLLTNRKKEINIFDKDDSLFDNRYPENRVYNRCLEIILQKD